MIKTLIGRIRTSLNTFIKKHIVDDEENLWPGNTPTMIEEEERLLRRDNSAA